MKPKQDRSFILQKVNRITDHINKTRKEFCEKHPTLCKTVDRFKEPVAYGLTLLYVKKAMMDTISNVDEKFEEFKKYNQLELDYLKGRISKREMEEFEKEAPKELKLVPAKVKVFDDNGDVVDEEKRKVRAYLIDLFPEKYQKLP